MGRGTGPWCPVGEALYCDLALHSDQGGPGHQPVSPTQTRKHRRINNLPEGGTRGVAGEAGGNRGGNGGLPTVRLVAASPFPPGGGGLERPDYQML